MKILFIGPNLDGPGGIQAYYRSVLPHITCSADYFSTGRIAAKKKRGSIVQSWLDYKAFKARLNKYDVVVFNPTLEARCFFRDIPFLRLAYRKKKKVIIFFHGWRQGFAEHLEKYLLFFFRRWYSHADAMIVLASEFRRSLQRWGFVGEIELVTTVVHDDWTDLKPNLCISDKIRILFLSRVEHIKGVYELVDGIGLLKEIPVECRIVGDGKELQPLREYVDEKGYNFVKFYGYLKGQKKQAAYLDADLYILPSYTEGMPTSVLEAMVCGLPVVVSKVGGVVDFFEDGKMGLLLNNVSADEIAQCLRRLIEQPTLRADMAAYNAKYADAHFRASEGAVMLQHICTRGLV